MKLTLKQLSTDINGGQKYKNQRQMRGLLYIIDDQLGTVDFKVTDESMGVIGGELKSNRHL